MFGDIMNPQDFLKGGKVHVWKADFAIIKSKKTYDGAFANIVDKKEITVVIDQLKYNKDDAVEVEENWKILTFDMVLPFDLIGFLAFIAKVLAEANISIFVVSAYSTDHILIKKENLPIAKKVLEKLGCIVEEHT